MGANVVMLQTKSGTRTLHGNAFEFLRNDKLNAPNFAPTVPALKQNIFGYNVGGPVYIPGVYGKPGQDVFLSWSQQWRYQNLASVVLGATPTDAMKQGIFDTPIKAQHGAAVSPDSIRRLPDPAKPHQAGLAGAAERAHQRHPTTRRADF